MCACGWERTNWSFFILVLYSGPPIYLLSTDVLRSMLIMPFSPTRCRAGILACIRIHTRIHTFIQSLKCTHRDPTSARCAAVLNRRVRPPKWRRILSSTRPFALDAPSGKHTHRRPHRPQHTSTPTTPSDARVIARPTSESHRLLAHGKRPPRTARGVRICARGRAGLLPGPPKTQTI